MKLSRGRGIKMPARNVKQGLGNNLTILQMRADIQIEPLVSRGQILNLVQKNYKHKGPTNLEFTIWHVHDSAKGSYSDL